MLVAFITMFNMIHDMIIIIMIHDLTIILIIQGAVAVSFLLFGTSFIFVNSHLTAHTENVKVIS